MRTAVKLGTESVNNFNSTSSEFLSEIQDSISNSGFEELLQPSEILDFNCSIIEDKSFGKTFIIPVKDSNGELTSLVMGFKGCNANWKVKYINKLFYTLKLLTTQKIINHDFYAFLLSCFDREFCSASATSLALRDDVIIDFDDGTRIIIDGNGVITWVIIGGCQGNTTGSATVIYGSNGEIIWQAGNNNSTVGRWDVGEDSGFDGSWSSFPGNNGGGSPTDPILSTNYDLMQYSLDHISLVKMNNMATKIMEHYNLNIPYTEFWNNLSQSGALELILANIGTWNNSMTFNDINEINIFIDEYKELLFLVDIGYSLDNTNSLNTPAYIWLVGHNPQFFFIKNNYNTSQDDEFARWSIEFLMQHPNTTQAQFENWFMGEVEGPDLGFDEAFWNNPANNFPHQDLPSWAYFDDAYPRINGRDMTRDEIVNLVGGQVKVIADQYNIGMVCALKLSRALNYTGVVSIPNIPSTGDYPGTVQGGDGLYYFMNAEAMNRWMRKTFGCANPNTSIGEYFNPEAIHWADADLDKNEKDVLNYVKSNHINGIYSAVARKDQFNASGHCDLIKEDGTCVRSCYFQQASSFKWIDIWKLH